MIVEFAEEASPRQPAGYLGPLLAEYENLLACVRCGLCLTSCPTYVLSQNEAEGPRGRISLARALVEGELELTPELIEHEQNCLVCDACTAVCPAGVNMDAAQVALRASLEQAAAAKATPTRRVLRSLVMRGLFGNQGRFRLLVGALRLYQRLGLQWLARTTGALKLFRLAELESVLPPIPSRFLAPAGERYLAEPGEAATQPAEVSFFAGCVMATALADVDRATIRVLQRAGCSVTDPASQGCCGALNAHNGDLDGARAMAKRNIAAFEQAGADSLVVVNSAGCGAMLKEYDHLLRDDPDWAVRATAFAARVRDVSEVLATRPLPLKRPLAQAVVYQDPCHLLHAQRISKQPRVLLGAIPEVTLCEPAEPGLCCGSAGIYNVTNPDTSRQLQHRKVENLLATGAKTVATANPGCLMQLRAGFAELGRSDVRVCHLVELLDEASAP